MSSPIYQAIRQLSEEKDIPEESVIETIEAALAAAFRKDFGEKDQNVKVNFDKETGDFDVFDVKTVVEDMELPEEDEETEGEEGSPKSEPKVEKKKVEEKKEAAEDKTDDKKGSEKKEGQAQAAEAVEGGEEDDEPKFNPKTDVMITAARESLKPDAEVGEEIRTQLEVPDAFGRMAAQTAKQVIIQKIREAERVKLFGEFKDREQELVNATVQRREGRLVLIDLGRVTGIMPPDEQVPTERYMPGDRVKVYIVRVEMTARGPEIVVSRSHPDIIRRLFTLEIPEVAAGTVEIHGVAREAGARAKVAVSSHQENVDPIGSCIGQRGTRIQTVIAELGGEKVDVIMYDDDPKTYITNALSPAKVAEIDLDEEARTANVLVDDDQLSLAIGRGGQNVRLASRLTNWKINIRKDGEETPAFGADAEGAVTAAAADVESDGESPAEDKAADETEEEAGSDDVSEEVVQADAESDEKPEEDVAEEKGDENDEDVEDAAADEPAVEAEADEDADGSAEAEEAEEADDESKDKE